MGQVRRFERASAMSALPPKADIRLRRANRRCSMSYTSEQPIRNRAYFVAVHVEPFSEPAVHRSEQFARVACLALVAPEAREAHCGTEFPGFCLLLACDREWVDMPS